MLGTITSLEALIRARQKATRDGTATEYHGQVADTADDLAKRPELLAIGLDQLVTELAEARDADARAQAERRALVPTNTDARPAGPYRG